MNRLELLLKRMKAGSIKDPDLLLALQYIHSIQLDKHNETKSEDIERTSDLFERTGSDKRGRPKTKGL